MAVLASRPVVGSSRKSTGGSIISSMPIFVLFLSPPETPQILCVPTCKTSQSEQPSIQVPHSMNYNTDCSNSSRLPLLDHCYVPICDTELLFEYFSVCSFSGFSCPFSLFYFHCRRWRADWPSRLSIIRDELIGYNDVRGGVFNHAC